ncbi:MAG: YdjY domain-containing protein [Planctomycetota bacterium]
MNGCLIIIMATALSGLPVDLIPGTESQPGETVALGAVQFEAATGTIHLDGFFNMSQGFVEYLINLPGAKSHECLIAVDCDPMHLQTALMLMEVKESRSPESERDLGGLTGGDRLVIHFHYPVKDGEGRDFVRRIRAENCIINAPMEREMVRCGFAYTGSGFLLLDPPPGAPEGAEPKDEFMARVTGELISLSHRPWAILDNPLALPYPDGDYFAYGDVLPWKKDGNEPPPVRVSIRKALPGEIDPDAIRMELPRRGSIEPETIEENR